MQKNGDTFVGQYENDEVGIFDIFTTFFFLSMFIGVLLRYAGMEHMSFKMEIHIPVNFDVIRFSFDIISLAFVFNSKHNSSTAKAHFFLPKIIKNLNLLKEIFLTGRYESIDRSFLIYVFMMAHTFNLSIMEMELSFIRIATLI